MALIDVGRVCRKTQGRDAGGFCVVVDKPQEGRVLVDGRDVRRKKVSLSHVEPTGIVVGVKKGADTVAVVSALKEGKLIK